MGEDAPNLGPHGRLNLESGVPEETRKALEAIGWKIGVATGAFGRYEGIEHRIRAANASMPPAAKCAPTP